MRAIRSFILINFLFAYIVFSAYNTVYGQDGLTINEAEYFEMPGLTIMVFDDYYPVGRQGGVTIIQNGVRVAANCDLQVSG